jgi:tetratricopeptide (TPR) repeat protein
MGVVPCIIPDLPPGSYRVEVEGPDFRRSFPVDVKRGTLSRVYVDNTSAEPLIELKKIGVVSDGTLFGYIEANVPLIVVVILFLLGCIAVMIHAVKLRKEGEEEGRGNGRKKGSKDKKSGEDPAEEEKDLLREYHNKTRILDAASSAGDPGSGSSSEGGQVHTVPSGPMKNVRKFSRDMLDSNQGNQKGITGGAGGAGVSSESARSFGRVELSLKDFEARHGSGRARISALNQTSESISVEGVQVGPGISADIRVDVDEPQSEEYEMTITLRILDEIGHTFYQHLQVPYNRGIALVARGILEKAYEYYQGVIQKNPRHVDALFRKAKILSEWGLDEEAGEVLAQVYSVFPDHEGARVLSRQIEEKKKKREQEKKRVLEKPRISGFPDSLGDRYTPVRLLGKDSFASIILAIRNDTGEIRALKIAREGADVGSSVYTEISVLYQLRHPNVLKMFRAEFHPTLFLELEYVSGIACGNHICRTLADLTPPVSMDLMYSLMEGIASGVAYIHSKGVRHYHLSPKYILLDEPLTPKISGLMKGSLIQAGSGKEDRMIVRAPEQLNPEMYGKPGKKTDLFQIGIIWHWLMTGIIPTQGSGDAGGDQKRSLSGVYIPPGISHPAYFRYNPLLQRLIAPDKRDRYGSADEFLAELKRLPVNDSMTDSSLS